MHLTARFAGKVYTEDVARGVGCAHEPDLNLGTTCSPERRRQLHSTSDSGPEHSVHHWLSCHRWNRGPKLARGNFLGVSP